MVLFSILAVTLILLTIFMVLVVGAGGAVFSIVFADVIVCMGIIILVMKWLVRKKK